jgi:hypothetical protein
VIAPQRSGDETLARLRKHGAQLVSSEVVQYEDSYRLCYIRGPEGLLMGSLRNSAEQHHDERPPQSPSRRSALPTCSPRKNKVTRR